MSVLDQTLREFVGYNAKRAFNVIQADVNRVLQPFGLRMVTFSALAVIARTPGLNQSMLADTLAIERPNIVPILDDLQAAGLIARERSREDRRAYALHPTAAGTGALNRARAAVAAHDRRMTQGLTADEVARLIATLQRIEANGGKADDG